MIGWLMMDGRRLDSRDLLLERCLISMHTLSLRYFYELVYELVLEIATYISFWFSGPPVIWVVLKGRNIKLVLVT